MDENPDAALSRVGKDIVLTHAEELNRDADHKGAGRRKFLPLRFA